MAQIRSWSGGRLLEEVEQCRPSSFDIDNHEERENRPESAFEQFEARTDSDIEASSESYVDDFTDEESFCDALEAISLDDQNDLGVAISSPFFDAVHVTNQSDYCKNDYEQESESSSSSQSSGIYSSFDDHASNDYNYTSMDCEEDSIIDHAVNNSIDGSLKGKRDTFLHANKQHKKWLVRIQHVAKLKREADKDTRLQSKKRETKRRNMLVLRARDRKEVGYDCATEAAKYNRIKAQPSKNNVQDNNAEVDEKNQYNRKMIQRQSRIKYRKYLKSIIQRREMKGIKEENAIMQAEKMKRKATQMVLDEIRHKSEALKSISTNLNKVKEISNEKKDDEIKQGEQILHNVGYDALKIQEFKKRYSAKFAMITLDRQMKKRETERLKRRLEKRAAILRRQYEENLTDVKLVEKQANESTPHEQPENHNKAKEHNCTRHRQTEIISVKEPQKKNIILTPSKVKALAARLSNREDVKKKSNSKHGDDTFDEWKHKNRLNLNQKVFCMTGWYPSVSQITIFHFFTISLFYLNSFTMI